MMDDEPGVPQYEVGESAMRLDFADGLDIVCRWPVGAPAAPVAVLCHGFTGTASNLAELATAWAASGYIVVQPTFDDSLPRIAQLRPELGIDPAKGLAWAADPDTAAAMVALTFDTDLWTGRVDIATFVLDRLEQITSTMAGLDGGADLERIAVAGHSMGAYTTQLLGGVTIDFPGAGITSFRDDRVKAVALLAGQGRNQWGLGDGSWDTLATPLLNIVGTADNNSASGQGPDWRKEPFDLSPPGERYQAVIHEMDHGLGGLAGAENPMWADDPVARGVIIASTTAFFDHALRGDTSAAEWLAHGPPGADVAAKVDWSVR